MDPGAVTAVVGRTRRIDGWFSPDACALFGLLDEVQKANRISGDLFEIGAHHGKSAVMLCAMARSGESVGVCDVFGSSGENPSGSGYGDRRVFETNIAQYADGTRIDVFAKPSSELTAAEIGGPFRFFHVDGGHHREEALGDLQLAATVLDGRGVIAVDDPFRPEWPGVTEAILAFCQEQRRLLPLTLGFNKLILVRAEIRELYEGLLLERAWMYLDPRVYSRKTLPVAGVETHIFFIPTTRQFERATTTIARWTTIADGARSRILRRP